MNSRVLGAGVVLATLAIGTAAAPGDTRREQPAKRITATGVGQVKLGKTHRRLREQNLVGVLRPGCELGGPDTRSARLLRPLRGSVNYTLTNPRKVTDIAVRGGAKARGVGIGDTIPEIRAAFPRARVDRSTEEVFGITLVRIPRNGGGRLQFAVDVDSDRITLIGIPRIAFCE